MTISINIDHLSDDELYAIYKVLKLKFDRVEREKILMMDLQDMDVQRVMTINVINLLKFRRISTIQDLAACTRSTLEKINGMGPQSLKQIERLLHKYGLELAKNS